MKNIKTFLFGIMAAFVVVSCSKDFLEYEPEGVLSNENVATAENAEALVVAAYAGIANDEMVGPLTHMWV
ncbi:MAG: RagB/SusD family nutrient uptake outer membrane protein, partial [Flavobacteriales bacterium]